MPEEVIIRVHGTFASAGNDEGLQWWQRESDFEKNLSSNLNEKYKSDVVFHWSGLNTSLERRSAAHSLLSKLQELEYSETPYHLIGHSHGGSVVWETLLLAYMQQYKIGIFGKVKKINDKALNHLMSWSTVGTPFIHVMPVKKTIALNLFNFLIMLISFIILLSLFFMPTTESVAAASANADSIAITIVKVSFIVVISVFLIIFLGLFVSGLEAIALDKEKHIEWEAFKKYGSKWLGLWHIDDEAINGLKVSVHMKGPVIKRRSALYKSFSYPVLTLPLKLISIFSNFIYNKIYANLGDGLIINKMKVLVSGGDRPGSYVHKVSECPVLSEVVLPTIPDPVMTDMSKLADAEAVDSLPKLRKLISSLSNGYGTGLLNEVKSSGLTGDELIHTTYFKNDSVSALLAKHILDKSNTGSDDQLTNAAIDPWYDEFNNKLDELVDSLPAQYMPFSSKVKLTLLLILSIFIPMYILVLIKQG